MNTRLRCSAFTAIMLCAGLLALLACGTGPPGPTPFPTLPPAPTPVVLPSFLAYVFPRPGSLVEQAQFRSWSKLNWVGLELAEIAEPGEVLQPEDLQDRTQLLVDSRPLEVELAEDLGGGEAGRAEVLVSSFLPDLGEHQATVLVRRTSGEMLEFNWRFTVVEELTIPGLPEGFQFVRPLPDSTITLQDYRGGDSVPAEYVPGFADLRGGICYGILARKVVEPGEILPDGLEVSKKAHFVALDGVPPGPDADIRVASDLGLYEARDATGRVITSYGGMQHYSCWRVDLAPGRHEVTVRLERASGKVTEFTWWFVIRED